MGAGRDRLVIDARPNGPRGLLAEEPLLGRPVLGHLLDLSRVLGFRSALVIAPDDRADRLREVIGSEGERDYPVHPEPPAGPSITLRADRLYDPRRLRAALQRGQDPERAVIWRLDDPAMLAGAGQEWLRRRTYQPIGQFWALGLARSLARSLRDTAVGPNVLTVLGALTMLAASALIAWWPEPGPVERLVVAAVLAIGLVLDMADGHLARLQGSSSTFGRWLDGFLDEGADMALHAAIAWSQFAATGNPAWLLAGMLFGMGKFAFAYGNLTWDSIAGSPPEVEPTGPPNDHGRGLRRAALALGHADVRWHLWIVLAALGALHVELLVFAAYYPARALVGAFRKRHLATHG